MRSVGRPMASRGSSRTAPPAKQVAVLRTNNNTWGIKIREGTRLGITRNLSVFVLNDRKHSDVIVELECRRIASQLVLMVKPIKPGTSIRINQPSAPSPFNQETTLSNTHGSTRPPQMQLAWDTTISVSQNNAGGKESPGLIRLELGDDPGFSRARTTLIEKAVADTVASRNRHVYHGTRRGPNLRNG
ncbi:MAG: hypothetical protein HQ596_05105 [Candidatus Saganbacteria bacterium]|nr:hypothetical protein [Candidatus Saganbacteria bacterium]